MRSNRQDSPIRKGKMERKKRILIVLGTFVDLSGDVSIADWIWNAMEGNVESYGLE